MMARQWARSGGSVTERTQWTRPGQPVADYKTHGGLNVNIRDQREARKHFGDSSLKKRALAER